MGGNLWSAPVSKLRGLLTALPEAQGFSRYLPRAVCPSPTLPTCRICIPFQFCSVDRSPPCFLTLAFQSSHSHKSCKQRELWGVRRLPRQTHSLTPSISGEHPLCISLRSSAETTLVNEPGDQRLACSESMKGPRAVLQLTPSLAEQYWWRVNVSSVPTRSGPVWAKSVIPGECQGSLQKKVVPGEALEAFILGA